MKDALLILLLIGFMFIGAILCAFFESKGLYKPIAVTGMFLGAAIVIVTQKILYKK